MPARYIEAECHCGYEHGVSGGKCCGRFWDVPVLHAEPVMTESNSATQSPSDSDGLDVGPKSGDVDAVDQDAQLKARGYAAQALPLVRKRADSWIAGLTAITGVLTTAALIKGPDSLDKVDDRNIVSVLSPRDIVVILLFAGGLMIAIGIFQAYRAANGYPTAADSLDRAIEAISTDPHHAASRWRTAIAKETVSSRKALGKAVGGTIVGTAILAAAVAYASYKPASESPSTTTCLQLSDGSRITISGALPTIKAGAVTVVACPKG
jgi:hypothetical protein